MVERKRVDWWINWHSWLFGFAFDRQYGLSISIGPLSIVIQKPGYEPCTSYDEGTELC